MDLDEPVRPAPEPFDADVLAAILPPGEVVDRAEQVDLEPLPKLVAPTRRFVSARVPALDEETHDALVLLTSELVTNAIIHARTPLRVGVIVSRHYVAVTVHDLDLGHSEVDPHLREGGRGLGMVEALADAWAIRQDADGGKTAWFRLPRR